MRLSLPLAVNAGGDKFCSYLVLHDERRILNTYSPGDDIALSSDAISLADRKHYKHADSCKNTLVYTNTASYEWLESLRGSSLHCHFSAKNYTGYCRFDCSCVFVASQTIHDALCTHAAVGMALFKIFEVNGRGSICYIFCTILIFFLLHWMLFWWGNVCCLSRKSMSQAGIVYRPGYQCKGNAQIAGATVVKSR
jgi:hypothetical protein